MTRIFTPPIEKHTELKDKEVGGIIDHADGSVTLAKLGPETFKKIVEIDITTATTQVTITGLDLNTDRHYILIFKGYNSTPSGTSMRIFPNNDLTVANFYSQFLYASGGYLDYSRYNEPRLIAIFAGECSCCTSHITLDPNGRFRVITHGSRHDSNLVDNITWTVCSVPTYTNLTRLDLISVTANALSPGSRIILYRAG